MEQSIQLLIPLNLKQRAKSKNKVQEIKMSLETKRVQKRYLQVQFFRLVYNRLQVNSPRNRL